MDRLSLDQSVVDAKREELLTEEGDPLDRRHRTVTHGPEFFVLYEWPVGSGTWHPSKVRQNDDLAFSDGAVGRAICPAQARDTFFAWVDSGFAGMIAAPYKVTDIVDRAPADPNEPAPHFPILPATEEPPPPDGPPAAPPEGEPPAEPEPAA